MPEWIGPLVMLAAISAVVLLLGFVVDVSHRDYPDASALGELAKKERFRRYLLEGMMTTTSYPDLVRLFQRDKKTS